MKTTPVFTLLFFWFTVLAIVVHDLLHVDISLGTAAWASLALTILSLGGPALVKGFRQGLKD